MRTPLQLWRGALGLLLICGCGLPGNRIGDGGPVPEAVAQTSEVPLAGNEVDPPPPPAKPPCPPLAGNEVDVGLSCAGTGSECDKSQAVFCAGRYSIQPNYCTRSCETEADCGTGAKCIAGPENKATFWCVPDGCVPRGYPTDVKGPGLAACLPPTGNSRGLGRPCNGGLTDCLKAGLQLCTTSLLKNAPLAMCTTLCKVDDDCGEAMVCGPAPGLSEISVCIPKSCMP